MTELQEKHDSLVPQKIPPEFVQPSPQSAQLQRLAAFTPVNLTEAIALSKLIASSDLAPKEYKGKPGNVLIAMQYSAELGIAPVIGLQNISIINGRAAVWGDLFLALIQTSPQYEWHKEWLEGSGDNRVAVCQMKRKGHEVHTTKFSVADAKTAKLWMKRGYNGQDTPWVTNPDRMLQMRARGFGGRDKFSDALKGLSMAEEVMFIAPDASDAKKQREMATLDIGATVTDLQPSSEQNRGHNDTGLERRRDEQKQPEAKPEDWMCSECSGKNKHEESCSHFAKWKQDAKTSKPMRKELLMVVSVEEKTKKKGDGKYLIVNVTDNSGKGGKLFCWHLSLKDYLYAAVGKPAILEISEDTKDGKTFHCLEHVLEIAGITFVDDKPAEQAEMPAQTQPATDDDGF